MSRHGISDTTAPVQFDVITHIVRGRGLAEQAGTPPQHERCECDTGRTRRGRHRTVGDRTKMRRCVVSAIVQK